LARRTLQMRGSRCSRDVPHVGPQGILRSAPRKTAQTCCALVTATVMTVAVWTAGTLEAYFFPLVLRPPPDLGETDSRRRPSRASNIFAFYSPILSACRATTVLATGCTCRSSRGQDGEEIKGQHTYCGISRRSVCCPLSSEMHYVADLARLCCPLTGYVSPVPRIPGPLPRMFRAARDPSRLFLRSPSGEIGRHDRVGVPEGVAGNNA
jgi:hypothetical protein